jgi:hypothetical protein
MAERPAQGDNEGVAEAPRIKRYALVQNDSNDGMRRFHLARVTSPRRVADASRLERMEDVAAREGPSEEAGHVSQPGVD